MIRALIFDFDGLILDTELPDLQSWQEVYGAYGCSLPLSAWAACIGGAPDLFDPYEYLEAQIGRPVNRGDVSAKRERRYAELLAEESALPGVEDYVADARRLRLKLGIASSSSQDWVTGHLSRLALREHFDCVKCSDDVSHVKPDPQLYHAVLGALALRPDEAIAFEDSPNGILAAKRAGLFCVAVPNRVTRQLSLDHADVRLTSLADLSLELLLSEIQAHGF